MSQGADWSREPETNTPQWVLGVDFWVWKRDGSRNLSIPIVIVSLVWYIIFTKCIHVWYIYRMSPDLLCFKKNGSAFRRRKGRGAFAMAGTQTCHGICMHWTSRQRWSTRSGIPEDPSPNANQRKTSAVDVLSANGWRYLMYLRDLDPKSGES